MSHRVVILGAGFGGLELSTVLSESIGDEIDVTLIDKSDAFVFGYSKLDVMFGRAKLGAVRLAYREIAKPGVHVVQETVTEIDPEARRVTTDAGVHEADALVIALGADYDLDATPGLAEAGNEFYSVGGAERLAGTISRFSEGHAVVAVCDAPYKCPPAPAECALLLHDALTARGVRDACRISFVTPFSTPLPPSPDASAALEREFADRDITLIPNRRTRSLDPERGVAVFADGAELAFDLLLAVPKHRAPAVVIASDMTKDGYIPVDPATLQTRYPGVYAVGDVNATGVPMAGVFAEGEARVVARHLIAQFAGGEEPGPFDGRGACYIEFGRNRVGRVDIDFLSGPERTGTFTEPSAALVAEKEQFGSDRRARWFGVLSAK